MNETYRQKDFLWGALVGGAVATLTSLLFTTKKGKQIQRQIADTCDEVEDTVKEVFSDAKGKVEETADQLEKRGSNKPKHDAHQKDSK